MKLLFDFLPIILFFVVYKSADIYWATGVAIVVSALQVAIMYAVKRRVEKMQLATLAIIAVLGGATLILHNERFIMWKPTLVNWLFALVFLGSQFIGEKPLIQRMMEKAVQPPPALWIGLNLAWVLFFILTGALNLYVAYTFSENAWVNFKLFGLLGLTIAFIIAQGFILHKYMLPDEAHPPKE